MTMKKNKAKKRKLNFVNFSAFTFLLTGFFNVGTSLFLRSYNDSLSTKKQTIEAEIETLQIQNDAVAVEVNALNNRERVTGIAADSGLSMDQENIITITKTNGD